MFLSYYLLYLTGSCSAPIFFVTALILLLIMHRKISAAIHHFYPLCSNIVTTGGSFELAASRGKSLDIDFVDLSCLEG